MSERVLLIGWDGADWKLIDPLLEQGRMPHLERLLERGVMGNLLTLKPALSPMLWNSVATGKHGDKHGILGFVEPRPDGRGIQPVSSHSRRCKALWNVLSEHGMRAHVVNWFATHPAERIDGVMVSDLFSVARGAGFDAWPVPRGSVHPEGLQAELADLRVHPADLSAQLMLHFVPEAARVDQHADRKLATLARRLAHLYTVHALATRLGARDDWSLLCVYYETLDRVAHDFMEYRPPRMPHVAGDAFEIYRDVVDRVYEQHDLMLGRLLEIVGEQTHVVLISDHGFHGDHLRPEGSASVDGNPVSWHRDLGIFAAAGPRLKRDERVYGMTLLDVAPTLLTLLGLPVAEDMDGRPQHQIFEERPLLEWVESYESPRASDTAPLEAADVAASASALEDLRDLGYLDPAPPDSQEAVRRAQLGRLSTLGEIHRSNGRLEQAISSYREQLALVEEEPDARLQRAQRTSLTLQLAHAHVGLRAFEEAEALAGEVLDPGADPLAFHQFRGRLAAARRSFDEAVRHYDAAVTLSPDDLQLLANLGICHVNQGAWGEAEKLFLRMLELDPDAEAAFHYLGVVHYHQGRFEEASRCLMRAVSLRHLNPRGHFYLGLATLALGRIPWAVRALEEALEQEPTLERARGILERLRARGGDLFLEHRERRRTSRQPQASRTGERDASAPLTLVSGLPRSGTSLMMQMLEAGGLPPLCDDERPADAHNPRGYYEWAPVKRLQGAPEALEAAEGRSLKVISSLLRALPSGRRYRVIFMDRRIEEVCASQAALLARPGEHGGERQQHLERHREHVKAWLRRQSHIELCEIDHAEAVRQPLEVAAHVRRFLDLPLDVPAMARVVDPTLHRQRAR